MHGLSLPLTKLNVTDEVNRDNFDDKVKVFVQELFTHTQTKIQPVNCETFKSLLAKTELLAVYIGPYENLLSDEMESLTQA